MSKVIDVDLLKVFIDNIQEYDSSSGFDIIYAYKLKDIIDKIAREEGEKK